MPSFRNEQILKLDIKQQQPNAIPRFVQYDSATLKIELYDNGKKYDVSRAEEFVVSIKRPDGEMKSGLAEYDGEFINYKLTKQDLEELGEVQARLQVYQGRHRLSSLSFRYDVYEDYETIGSVEEQTLLSELFTQLHNALTEAQRQGNYAENRGDFANSAGDYATEAGDSQKMHWLMYVDTVEDRDSEYPNPQNGDTVYVVQVEGTAGGGVFRYNSIQQPPKWELISGYDTSVIQDIYNILSTKETKEEVERIANALLDDLEALTIGGTNLASVKPEGRGVYNLRVSPTTENVYQGEGLLIDSSQGNNTTRYLSLGTDIDFKSGQPYTGVAYVYDPNDLLKSVLMYSSPDSFKEQHSEIVPMSSNYKKVIAQGTAPSSGKTTVGMLIYFHTGFAANTVVSGWKIEKGTRPTDWSPSPKDIAADIQYGLDELDRRFSQKTEANKAEIEVLKDKITMTVEKEKFNEELQLLEQWKSERIQEADSIRQEVSHKVGDSEIISKINQSAEEIDIDASRIRLGGDVIIENGQAKIKYIDFSKAIAQGGSATEYLQLDNDEIVLRGLYDRVWRGQKHLQNDVITRLRDGHLRFRNNTQDRSLYYSDFGISTYIDGDGGSYSSGTINFFDNEYSTARGITMESNMGVVALRSNQNRVIIDSQWTANIESAEYSVYIRPFRDTRAGINEFQFGVKSNPSADATDGYIAYGDLSNSTTGGAGLRFSKTKGKNTIYATNSNGDMGTGHFVADTFTGDLVAPSSYVYAVGQRLRVIKNTGDRTEYAELQASDIQADTIRVNNAGANFYIGVSTGELRVTNNSLWQGSSTSYKAVRASQFIESSSEKFKSNIELWEDSVLDQIKNRVKLYSYNLDSDIESGVDARRHGVIIERETPEDWINGDGVINYEMISWALKGLQELAVEHDKVKTENKDLRNEVDSLRDKMAELEKFVLDNIK